MFRNILVPTDGSALSRKAIRRAVQLAREQGARITGLHVVAPYSPNVSEDIAPRNFETPQQYAKRSAAAAREHLQVIERAAKAAGVPCQTLHAASNFPHDEIVRTARRKKCDAIYMASHGRRGIARLLLGSEASKVIALSKVPVIISK